MKVKALERLSLAGSSYSSFTAIRRMLHHSSRLPKLTWSGPCPALLVQA